MSSLGDALLLSNILGSKKEKEMDPVRAVYKLEKLLKKLKGEDKKDDKKKETAGGLNQQQWALLLFASIPVLSVVNFWILTELMVMAVNALHNLK